MSHSRRRSVSLAASIAALVVAFGMALSFGAGGARAQAMDSHPAHIHKGTCDKLGDVVFPLSNVGPDMQMNQTPMAGTAKMGAQSAVPVQVSVTTVKAALKDLVDGGYAINVHESKDKIQTYIACGAVGGTMMGDKEIIIGLAELNKSGYRGIATLTDNGDGTTMVAIFLTEEYAASAAGTPAAGASPAAGSSSGVSAMAVELKNFAFNPANLDIPVGTTVTWTNNDSAPHTVTQDGGGFQSGKLDSGKSFSFKFDKAGTFAYHCEFHPNMHGTITVK